MFYPNGTQTCPQISSPYGPRSGGLSSFHEGVDFIGIDTARAAADGQVTFAGWMNNAAGNTVVIDHGNGVFTRYMHLASINVTKGQWVTTGQAIAVVGSTGNATGKCLHFEVRSGSGYNHRDPIAYIRSAGQAPPFPLAWNWYYGPADGPQESVSGFYGNGEGLATWQQRMADRGWSITVDGRYGPQTRDVARAFQAEKGLTVDGKIGPATWSTAWTAPIT